MIGLYVITTANESGAQAFCHIKKYAKKKKKNVWTETFVYNRELGCVLTSILLVCIRSTNNKSLCDRKLE